MDSTERQTDMIKIVRIPEARILIRHYQRGELDTLEMTQAIIRSFNSGRLALGEAKWMLENLKRLRKLHLNLY